MQINHILFPIDFSERSLHALSEAISFAQLFNAKLELLHVYHRPYAKPQADTESLLRKKRIQVEDRFEQLEKDMPALRRISYKISKEIGVSTEKIIEKAAEPQIDFIIMATKGAKGLGELWGSKTAEIVKHTHIPVLVIPNHAQLTSIDKITLACDYSKAAATNVLKELVQLAEFYKADIDVVTINRDEWKLTDSEQKVRKDVHHKLEEIPHSFSFIFHDDIEEGLLKFSYETGADLICILSKSYGFIESVFHDSLTQSLVFHSKLPLLVLK
jgi:nucleotide-binding universal stress UspA family protein